MAFVGGEGEVLGVGRGDRDFHDQTESGGRCSSTSIRHLDLPDSAEDITRAIEKGMEMVFAA